MVEKFQTWQKNSKSFNKMKPSLIRNAVNETEKERLEAVWEAGNAKRKRDPFGTSFTENLKKGADMV